MPEIDHHGYRFGLGTASNPNGLREILAILHFYQPMRQEELVGSPGQRASHFPEVNERIYQECYWPVLVGREGPLPAGLCASLYGPLREWMKGAHPEEFRHIRDRISQTPDSDYSILGDPYIHFIMANHPQDNPSHPDLGGRSDENLDMFIKIGRSAIYQDLGINPKGFWLPEAAVSKRVLKVLRNNGYELVVLLDNQLERSYQNPMLVKTSDQEQIYVIHADSSLSWRVSFATEGNDITRYAEDFLRHPDYKGRNMVWATDGELYGHHGQFKDLFLHAVLDPQTLMHANIRPLSIRHVINNPVPFTNVVDGSSWSCHHGLKRWTGDPGCNCTGGDHEDLAVKRDLRARLNYIGYLIDKALDELDPNWRRQFIPYFLGIRGAMYYNGNLEEEVARLRQEPGMELLRNVKVATLFSANMARWTAETSCAMFFGGIDRPERPIASDNLEQAQILLREINTL